MNEIITVDTKLYGKQRFDCSHTNQPWKILHCSALEIAALKGTTVYPNGMWLRAVQGDVVE